MADALARNAAVFDLLTGARVARDAADIARDAGNRAEHVRLRAKARTLAEEAERVDPAHEAPAWAEQVRGSI